MLIGATWKDTEISYWEPKVPENAIFRIFPNSDGLPPAWNDARFSYCQRSGAIPFISTKIDGDNTKLAQLKAWIEGMPAWVAELYVTDRHEPEGDLAAVAYKANFIEFWNMVNSLSISVRSKVKAGPILTRQWTENTPGRSYLEHDPGVGDFFGIDMYGNSWSSSDGSSVTTAYANPATFLSKVKAYKFNASDIRPRIFPEIGYIGAPFDADGSARASWLQGIYDEVKTWGASTTGWDFLGFIWWNTDGKSGASLTGIGTVRYFQLDRKHTGTSGSYVTLVPPKPLEKFNALAALENPSPPSEPDPNHPQYKFGYDAGLSAGKALGLDDGKDSAYTDIKAYADSKITPGD